MRIAFVTREFPPSKRMGGIATYVWESARFLTDAGHHVFVVCASDNTSKGTEYEESGVHVYRLPGGDFSLSQRHSRLNSLKSHIRRIACFQSYRHNLAIFLTQLVKERSIDLVEFAEYGAEASIWSKQKNQVPWIVRLHGPTLLDRQSGENAKLWKAPMKWWIGQLEMETMKRANAVSSPSKAMADKVATFSGIDPGKVTIIPNTINVSDWRSEPFRSEETDNKTSFRIFSAGAVTEGKGFRELVEAVCGLRQHGINITLEIAGKLGSLGRELAEKSNGIGEYKDWLKLLGPVPREDLASLYATADLVVFPSWWESFGLVCIEAMASGGLVLGSTAGGMTEIIEEGIDGFLVEPRKTGVLGEKIKAIAGISTERQDKIRKAAIRKIELNYSTQTMIKMQIDYYNIILDHFHRNKRCS